MGIDLTTQTGVVALISAFDMIERVDIIFTSLVLFSVAVRVYVRARMLHTFGREDWSMLVTLVFYCVFAGLLLAICMMGRRLFEGHFGQVETLQHTQSVGNGFFALSMISLKFSLGLFFLKLIGHKPVQRYIIYTILTLTTLVGAAYFGIGTFTCAIIKDIGANVCSAQRASTYIFATFSVVNITSDFVMTFIALLALVEAKLPLHTKVIAGSLLTLGCVGGVASIVRLVVVLEPVDPAKAVLQGINSGFWSFTELAVGIVAANLAMTRPLLYRMLEKLHLVSTRPATTTGTASGTAGQHRSHTAASRIQRSHLKDERDDMLLTEIRKETVMVVTEEERVDDSLHGYSAAKPRGM